MLYWVAHFKTNPCVNQFVIYRAGSVFICKLSLGQSSYFSPSMSISQDSPTSSAFTVQQKLKNKFRQLYLCFRTAYLEQEVNKHERRLLSSQGRCTAPIAFRLLEQQHCTWGSLCQVNKQKEQKCISGTILVFQQLNGRLCWYHSSQLTVTVNSINLKKRNKWIAAKW